MINARTIDHLDVVAARIPTDGPEADGTLEWDSTTIVVVRVHAGGECGVGYAYGDAGAAILARDKFADVVVGQDALAVRRLFDAMVREVRNIGRAGVASTAISAVDVAVWDLKARLLGVPLVMLLGAARDSIPVYGSGGFTSYSVESLQKQLSDWVNAGISRVKMKVGSHPADDLRRVHAAREAIGADPELFVDANGAYDRKQALAKAEAFRAEGVTWFEEPVTSDDLKGLRLLRDRVPAGMDIAAGEYGFDGFYFSRMLQAGAVDVLQVDATRCGGITGFLEAASLCEAYATPLSAHTAPSIHAHVCCATPMARHVEYFHDHVRIEQMLFDGAMVPVQGRLRPDPSRAGLGLELRIREAERYAA